MRMVTTQLIRLAQQARRAPRHLRTRQTEASAESVMSLVALHLWEPVIEVPQKMVRHVHVLTRLERDWKESEEVADAG